MVESLVRVLIAIAKVALFVTIFTGFFTLLTGIFSVVNLFVSASVLAEVITLISLCLPFDIKVFSTSFAVLSIALLSFLISKKSVSILSRVIPDAVE